MIRVHVTGQYDKSPNWVLMMDQRYRLLNGSIRRQTQGTPMEYSILTVLVCLIEHLKRPNECRSKRPALRAKSVQRLEENHKNQKPKTQIHPDA